MLNKAILVGRLTADPELRQTPNGVSVVSFTVAANRPYASKGGERQADFIDVVAWRQTAEFIAKYFRKGNAIAIDGTIQTRTYTDKNDNKRKAVEVVAENVSFVESKNAQSSGSGSNSRFAGLEPPPAQNQSPAYSSGVADDFEEILDDGELPF